MNTNNTINLNYLRVFNAVYKLRSTQKAAQELGVSQSAVSQTLAKLREYTSDKLFYSAGGTLHSTHRADILGSGLDAQLLMWDDKLNNHQFEDPNDFSGHMTIAVSSVLLETLASELTSTLVFERFPNARFNITIWNDDTPKDILEGRVDLALNFYPTELPKSIRAVPLTESKPVVLSRIGHPITDSGCSLEQFKKYKKGGIFIPGLPDYGAKLTRYHPDIFDFTYRSASMSVLVNLVQHSDLLVIAENLSATMAKGMVKYHQADWLSDFIPSTRYHAAYYLEKNHNTPLYQHCIDSIQHMMNMRQQM
ncbi:LysR family transcriptional regulator [Vibrio agarivorans]|uniref:LysR family transcriptional regulator n=1 Tax=Vibrio agarivorans TaxID=153622 RepID=A0ABT7XZI4_9VIBR|nr:LysR family transcriptional regulator [Vibrio agarivorans]MDN2481194.1 LysR family transcriptional regulator [Vibrio agarivorans]